LIVAADIGLSVSLKHNLLRAKYPLNFIRTFSRVREDLLAEEMRR
jgi:hypothetical protein